MKLSQMKQLLEERQIQLTKSLGQNFLHDRNQLFRIVKAAGLSKNDKVLEIGPGLGPLTELLLERASEVLAIEKDQRLVEVLREWFGSKLVLICADALEYVRNERRDWREWKLVSNLPYSVASPILVELALAEHGPERMTATLQLEVAQRLTAAPGDENYGILSLLVQLNYEANQSFKIPATCFFPQPEVDSACVTLARRPERLLPVAQQETFVKIVKRAFSQRRKMMMKLLKEDWSAEELNAAFEQLGLRANVRAETISLDQFVRLTKLLCDES
jgi:16S rRNA (adenine1518-N6/adenine1519-N6)-dimethyltransferase